jgi:hypothetical protein
VFVWVEKLSELSFKELRRGFEEEVALNEVSKCREFESISRIEDQSEPVDV